jgi:hypothetical protein
VEVSTDFAAAIRSVFCGPSRRSPARAALRARYAGIEVRKPAVNSNGDLLWNLKIRNPKRPKNAEFQVCFWGFSNGRDLRRAGPSFFGRGLLAARRRIAAEFRVRGGRQRRAVRGASQLRYHAR